MRLEIVRAHYLAAIVTGTVTLLCACSNDHTPFGGADGQNDSAYPDNPPGACSDNDTTLCDGFASSFTIKDSNGQAVSAFTAGEPITFEAQLTNTSSTSRTLTLKGGCTHIYFRVLNGSEEHLWTSDCGGPESLCLCATCKVTYAAGETKIITANWDQQQFDGTQTPVGEYTVNALDDTQCSPALEKSGTFSIQ